MVFFDKPFLIVMGAIGLMWALGLSKETMGWIALIFIVLGYLFVKYWPEPPNLDE